MEEGRGSLGRRDPGERWEEGQSLVEGWDLGWRAEEQWVEEEWAEGQWAGRKAQ